MASLIVNIKNLELVIIKHAVKLSLVPNIGCPAAGSDFFNFPGLKQVREGSFNGGFADVRQGLRDIRL